MPNLHTHRISRLDAKPHWTVWTPHYTYIIQTSLTSVAVTMHTSLRLHELLPSIHPSGFMGGCHTYPPLWAPWPPSSCVPSCESSCYNLYTYISCYHLYTYISGYHLYISCYYLYKDHAIHPICIKYRTTSCIYIVLLLVRISYP